MSKSKVEGFYLFAAGAALFLVLGCFWGSGPFFKMCDFKALSYAAQALFHHRDPYSQQVLQGVYYSAPENHALRWAPPDWLHGVTVCVNLPTSIVFFLPFALLPWNLAVILWTALSTASLIFAAWLMWKVASNWSPLVAGLLLFLLLSGSQAIVETGNIAGVVISLCVIGSWCLIQQRYVPLGVLCLALALVCKPQDAGFVWLYFLLAGGMHRRRAWQTLALCAALSVPATLWMYHVSPDWLGELRANVLSTSVPGQLNSPLSMTDPAWHGAMIVSLQTVTGVFTAKPLLYNAAVYLLCAPLILVWGIAILRGRPSRKRDWLGIATIVPISMLIGYHRQHDTRLLLLAIPACALLIAEQKRIGRIALFVTCLTTLASSNPLLEIFGNETFYLRHRASGFGGELLNAVLGRPVPLAMLIQGACLCFLVAHSSFAAEAWFGLRDRLRLTVRAGGIAPQDCAPTLENVADQEA